MSDGSSEARRPPRTWRRFLSEAFGALFRPTPPAPAPPRVAPVERHRDPRDVLWHRLIRSYFDYPGLVPKEFIRERLLAADPLVEAVLGIDQASNADDSFSSTAVVRLRDDRYAFLHKNEEHESGFVTESEIRCAVYALGHASEPEFKEIFERIVAGPFDRSLEGWMDVAADWWEEQGEEAAAAELRRIAEGRRHDRAMEGMTFEERMAYLNSLRA